MAEAQRGGHWLDRLREATRQSGPGWLLSAYTLGAGSAVSSLWAGADYGYQLLWIQPLSMLMGVIMLSGAAYVFCNSRERPYQLMARVSPGLAAAWGLGSLFASVIWHFPQYGLAHGAFLELFGLTAGPLTMVGFGAVALAAMVAMTWSYAAGSRGLTLYETIIKVIVWLMVLCLFVVVMLTPTDWGAVLRGLFVWRLPAGNMDLFYGMLSAAVGINMTFLYPYSVHGKQWDTDPNVDGFRVAVRDLVRGMLIPFVLATGLMIIATASTLHATGTAIDRGNIGAMGEVFRPFGDFGPTLFFIGILAMPLSSITLHMLTCGFILSEMTGAPLYGRTWKLGTLIPAIGVFGVAWKFPAWLPVSASALTLLFLPIAYVAFVLLFQRTVSDETDLLGTAETPADEPTVVTDTAPIVRRPPRWLLWPMVLVVLVVSFLALQKAYKTLAVDLPKAMAPAEPAD